MRARRLLVFGAAGRTGCLLADRALAAGWQVTAAVRTSGSGSRLPSGATLVTVDVLDRAATLRAVAAATPHVVISCIGGRGDSRPDDEGVRHIADGCVAAAVKRLLVVTSLGCGASRAHASPRLLEAIGDVLAAKTRAEEHVVALPLAWTVVRPGGLLDGVATGGGTLFEDERIHGSITCADLAALILALADDAESHRRILSAVDIATLSGPPDARRYARAGHRAAM